MAFCKRCPECAIVMGAGWHHRPPLKPIPVQRPFQIVGLDIIDLPCTEKGNKHLVVFQDMFTKSPLVFPVPDQKAERIVKLLCEEVVPLFSVPEALLTDRGANLLSHLMLDVCTLLGTEKLNTTAYHTLNVTAWLSGSTAHLRPCCARDQHSLEHSGTNMQSCGLIAIHHMGQPTKSHHFYCMVGIVGPQWKLHLYHPRM